MMRAKMPERIATSPAPALGTTTARVCTRQQRRVALRWLIRGAMIAFGAAGLALTVAHAQTPPPPAPPQTPPPAAPAGGGPPTPEGAKAPTAAAPGEPAKATVKIVLKVVPPNQATVHWGKKRLGIIKPRAPLILERPRDSGPMDLVIKCAGYVTVHTRIYTFNGGTVAVRLTPVDKKNTLYGYREELPPEPDPNAPALDGATPPPPPPPSAPPPPAP